MAAPTSTKEPTTLLERLVAKFGYAGLSGMLLLAMAVAAFAWANSPFAESYRALWEVKLTVGVGEASLSKALILWINDGLMAIFFLLVGLEIKRELLEGALSTPRRAALPVFAAIGGVAVPALIYAAVNAGGRGTMDGWAIPAATDIAFALGILALFGKRVPIELKVFLTALAVIDDLAAILIIAAFLTEKVVFVALGIAAVALAILVALNRAGVRRPSPYVLVGTVLWLAVLKSGVHATVAGVLLAMTIPARRLFDGGGFIERTRASLPEGDHEDDDSFAPDTFAHRVRDLCNGFEPPLLRWEHALQTYVLFFIMPLFALANAGVSLRGDGSSEGLGAVGWGVALGLMVGKPVGITAGAWIGKRLGVCEVPAALTWGRIHAAAWLGGIGFTMSLFITNLALTGPVADKAKLGLLMASVIAGVIGSILIVRTCPRVTSESPVGQAAPAPSAAVG